MIGLFLFIGCSDDPSGPTPDAGTDAPGQDTSIDTSSADVADTGPAPAKPPTCSAATFPTPINVTQASSAAEVEITPGKREMLVLGDFGTGGVGRALEISGADAGTERAVSLPLDGAASDDVEGMAWLNAKLYVLTSSGAAMHFVSDGGGGLTREQDAYAIGAAPTYSCADLTQKDCGKNYEGLCLRADAAGKACAGYAVAKTDGKLYCLTIDGTGKLVASTTVSPLDTKLGDGKVSDCAFGTAGGPAASVLVIATNTSNGSKTYRMDETTSVLTELPSSTLGNVEAIAVDKDGALYVFEDSETGATSATGKKSCTGW